MEYTDDSSEVLWGYTSSEGPKTDAGWIFLQYFHTGGENKEINDIK